MYDDSGNRTSHTNTDGTTVGYTVDDTGQLVSDSTGTTYTYDDAGNLTATSDGDSYVYDDYGRTASASSNGATATFGYDAANVRVSVNGEAQLWDRNGGLPTLISTDTGDNYVHTAGIARDGDDWLLQDAVGSVRATVDQTGATIGAQDFTVFGEQLTGTGSFGFAGEQQDPTGQLHLRARQYNPGLGRFTTVDPVQPGAPATTGYNLYAYSGNNPTTWGDPSGRAAIVGEAGVQRSVAGQSVGPTSRTGLLVAMVFAAAYAGIECVLERGPFGAPGEFLPGLCGLYDRTTSGQQGGGEGEEGDIYDDPFYDDDYDERNPPRYQPPPFISDNQFENSTASAAATECARRLGLDDIQAVEEWLHRRISKQRQDDGSEYDYQSMLRLCLKEYGG